ncbi:endothelial zinc finger protein induced by tumor necrosis factor alpha-like [Plectropomus leopardus]|uniref:endothelial zinc finger protein induced by tumor necrosis factor alpha-like n=1 Tax=Plectropomus leopardus TaxID=160734 RepID=UPI001C4D5512|nr:endothelial zinc finger protein induced by tumor necrosis factor alpha-like [Plectropomus leopardus]
MSKAETLRQFVARRLAAASQEILAAVDGLVAGYEEEAAGYREEIGRQRRQLQLLQAQLTCSAAGVKRSRSLDSVEEDEDDEDEESAEHRDKLEDSTNQTPSRCRYKKRKPGRPQISNTQNHVDLKIRILEDSDSDVLSNYVLQKSPLLKLRCPRGLQETDFMDFLRSSFPQLSGGDRRFDLLTCDKRRRLQPLTARTLTAEEIHGNLGGAGWRSTLYIRLKTQNEPQAGEEETRPLQTKEDITDDSLSTAAVVTSDETGPQTSCLVQQVEGRGGDVVSSCSTSQKDVGTEQAEDEDFGISDPAESKGSDDVEKEEEREEANDSDDDWKPDKSDAEPKESDSELQTTKRQKNKKRSGFRTTESKTEDGDDSFACKVCRVLHKSEVALVKHVWSHVDDSGSLCGACGELSESVEALKDHFQSRHKTEDCHICGESFLTVLSLNEHVAAHSGEKPYECDVCHDAFALKVTLEDHQKCHKTGKMHKCYTCPKVFALKEQLKAHRRTHTNKKTHLCGVCGKSLSDYRSLSRHKMTHSGERPHSCEVCGRRFKLPGTLRQHEKIHTDRERSYLCDVCCKMFLTSKQLQIHMRRHTNEKPYHCGECGRGFTTKGPLTIHMRIHTGETPYRCPECGWAFKRKTNLDNHVTVHSGLKPFVCGVCGKACARKSYLTVHMRTHNGERPFKCSLCDKAFTQSHCLKTHMKSHLVAEAAT